MSTLEIISYIHLSTGVDCGLHITFYTEYPRSTKSENKVPFQVTSLDYRLVAVRNLLRSASVGLYKGFVKNRVHVVAISPLSSIWSGVWCVDVLAGLSRSSSKAKFSDFLFSHLFPIRKWLSGPIPFSMSILL